KNILRKYLGSDSVEWLMAHNKSCDALMKSRDTKLLIQHLSDLNQDSVALASRVQLIGPPVATMSTAQRTVIELVNHDQLDKALEITLAATRVLDSRWLHGSSHDDPTSIYVVSAWMNWIGKWPKAKLKELEPICTKELHAALDRLAGNSTEDGLRARAG